MRISAKPELSDEAKKEVRDWAVGLFRGRSADVPTFVDNGGVLWIDGAPRTINRSAYFYREGGRLYLGRQLGRADSNIAIWEEIAIVVAMCSLAEVEFDEELEGALREALAKALAQVWQSLSEARLIRASGTPTQLAWNSSQIAARIDGEWVYGRTGQLAPVDETWTQVSL